MAEAISPHLTDPMLLQRLNRENLWEVLGSIRDGILLHDVDAYFKFRKEQLAELVQNYQTMSVEAEPPTPDIRNMSIEMRSEHALTTADQAELANMMSELNVGQARLAAVPAATGGRQMSGKAAQDGSVPPGPTADAQILLDELKDWWTEYENKIFTLQMRGDLELKNSELSNELRQMVELVRSGKADAVFLLIAIARVNLSRNGFLFTQFGKRLMKMNEQATAITNDLLAGSTQSTDYYAQLQITSQKQKEIGTQQQFLVQDMQKLTQEIERILSFAKTGIDDIFKTKLQIANSFTRN